MQVSWIDPDELSALAHQLLEPLPNEQGHRVQPLPDADAAAAPLIGEDADAGSDAPPESAHSAAFGSSSPELEQIRAKLRTIRDRAKDAGLLPTMPAAAEPETPPSAPAESQESAACPPLETAAIEHAPFDPAEGSIAERLDLFSRWALPLLKSSDFLLLDDHGDILWGVPSRADLKVQAMLMLRRAKQSPPPSAGQALHSQSHSGQFISVLRCPTRFGNVTIASLAAEAPAESLCENLTQALALAVNEALVDVD